jgi:hypothetical protein
VGWGEFDVFGVFEENSCGNEVLAGEVGGMLELRRGVVWGSWWGVDRVEV